MKGKVKNMSWVTCTTNASSYVFDQSSVGIETDLNGEIDTEENYCIYQKSPEMLNPMSSVFAKKAGQQIRHLEVPENSGKKLFEEAVAFLSKQCEGIDLKNITSLKFHANTYGLSSNNWFADNIICKMTKLSKIDFSDTVDYQHRSDLCMGISSMLRAVAEMKIIEIDLKDNFLDVDGARSIKDFIEVNKSLKILKMQNCRLGSKSAEILAEALSKNAKMKLEVLDLNDNNIEADGLKVLMPALSKMGSLHTFKFQTNIVDEKSTGLKII